MANDSHVGRMDPLFGYPAAKFVKRKSIFNDWPVSALNNTSDAVTNKLRHYQNMQCTIITSPWFAMLTWPFSFEVTQSR